MQQDQITNDGQDHGHGNDQGQEAKITPMTGTMIAFWSFAFSVFLLGVIVPNYISERSEAAKVFIESVFSVALVIVVIGQTYINLRQARALDIQEQIFRSQSEKMEHALEIERAKTNPRLRVSKVRMENFDIGESPIFITTIANDGFIDATGVELHIGITLGHDRAVKWIGPQTVMIPARGEESYPIVTGASVNEHDMEGFNTNVPIEVQVLIKYWPGSPIEPKEFCYRYLPWPARRRPDDVRQFFPCDFQPRLNTTLRVQSAFMKHIAETVTLAAPEASRQDKRQNKEAASGDPQSAV